ncbi:MAG TPA: dienelactone hydrolase family protein [Steroidobacteraceae bacterium]|nr:dienelactone hydrolase family protein [Steroidobacteraceae bacterium]
MAERDLSKRIVYRVDGMGEARVRSAVYKRDAGAELKMNIYTPAGLRGDARVPAVFFVHGGPIPADFTPPTQWGVFVSYGELVAASGLVGVTFNHRLFGLTDYERARSDVAAAIEYVRSHAAELNVDADRIALWYFSGGGPLLTPMLRDRPDYVRCLLAFYAYLQPAEAQVRAKSAGVPIFIARAGLDQPMINETIDRFVPEALAGNAALDLMNHSSGRHGFDILDDDDRSREIIARAVAFAQAHVRRSDR